MYKNVKRLADIIFAFVGLVFLSPVFLIVILFLSFTVEGEIFYLQQRMGYRNKPFGIFKFATMLKDSLNIGCKTVTVRNDSRITTFGKYLRFTKINELPQILNVIIGDMSIVGPRPLLVGSFYKYDIEVQKIIYQNRPGITGLGSLVFRDEEKLVSAYHSTGRDPLEYYKQHIYPYKGQLETWYFYNISFWTDLKIILLTIWSLFDSNSELVFKVFKDIPAKPETLTLSWIKNQSSTS